MNTKLMFSSESELWETPQDFFDALDREFHFGLDACATPENAKCKNFFTPKQDGLAQKWGGVWNNLVQSTVRPGNLEMGAESLQRIRERGNSCHAAAGADGHKMVSRFYHRKSRDPFCQRPPQIWQQQKFGAIPEHCCDF